MATQALAEAVRPPAAHPRHRPPTGPRPGSSASFILGLQRSVGNAAVAQHLARSAPGPARRTPPETVPIQRCGPTPCNCSDTERADYAAKHEGGESQGDEENATSDQPAAPVQRQNDPAKEPAHLHRPVQRSITERIDSVRGHGHALDDGTRRRLQRSLGTELSPVRIHTDAAADSLSRDAGATAFTSGHDIFFRSGAYDPSGAAGFKNLAHEVTHVVQQSNGQVPGRERAGGFAMSDEHDAGEQQAAATATHIAAGGAGVAGGLASVQRLTPLGAAPARPVVQRLTDPLGDDMVVDWTNPGAAVALTDQAGAPVSGGGALNFGGGDSASFTMPSRTASANVNFPVTASWHGKGTGPVPPGPKPPAQECDVCKILIDGATAEACALVASVVGKAVNIPGADLLAEGLVLGACSLIALAAGGAVIKILPDDLVKSCKTSSIDEIINKVRELKENIEKTSTLTDVFERIVESLKKIPGLGSLINLAAIPGLLRAETVKRLGKLIETLKAARDKCKGGGGGGTVPAGGQGRATSTMKTMVFLTPDGQVRAAGPGPAQVVSGAGATEESPVRFSQDGVPNSALITQVPTIVGNGPNGAKAGRTFSVNILFGLPPAPLPIDCPVAEFFPFKVAKDQFEDELDAQKKIRDWFFGHDPEIRNTVHTGASTVKVTGRASNTGKVEFNRVLAEKRAARVATIIRDFGGSDSKMRAMSLGFLSAQEAGEVGRERRADAKIEGEVPADRVSLMKGGDACSGHNNESADEGPTGPQTSPLPGLEGPGSEVPAPESPGTETAGDVFEQAGLGSPGEEFQTA